MRGSPAISSATTPTTSRSDTSSTPKKTPAAAITAPARRYPRSAPTPARPPGSTISSSNSTISTGSRTLTSRARPNQPVPSHTAPSTPRPPLHPRPQNKNVTASNTQNAPRLTATKATRPITSNAASRTYTANHTSPSSFSSSSSSSRTGAAPPSRVVALAGAAFRMPATDRPRQPQLSAAAAKAMTRPPLTPKVASARGSSVITPLGRRTHNPTAASVASSAVGSPILKDDATVSTPSTTASGTAAFLASNVTPRTGPRQVRVESANTTPSGTPNSERPAEGPENIRRTSPRESAGDTAESKFFYASDARIQQQAAQARPASVVQKPPTFFYANNNRTSTASLESNRTTSPPSLGSFSPLAPPPSDSQASKFFYANGTPDLAPPRTGGIAPSGSGSTVSSASRMVSRPGTSSSAVGYGPTAPPRPVSPVKTASMPVAQPLKANGFAQGQPIRNPGASPPSLAPTPNTEVKRASLDAAPKAIRGHARTRSVPFSDHLVMPQALSPRTLSPEPSSPPLSPGLSHPVMTMASILQAVEDLGEPDDIDTGLRSGAVSPTKSNHPNEAVSELVANARRERKVQDLEITNASLEAINRTLERQLRKQTAELRRYKRLSRSGRLSLASVASSRVTSAAHSEPPVDLFDLSEEDHSEEEEDEEEDDSLDDSDMSSGGETASATGGADALSSNAKAAARRRRDERRLQLDLEKHQELLVDSQKMNQSIKRCLDWTEVLIREGNKALAYSVRVSDVKLGGRVLAPADEDDEGVSHVEELGGRDAEGGESVVHIEEKSAPGLDGDAEMPVDGG